MMDLELSFLTIILVPNLKIESMKYKIKKHELKCDTFSIPQKNSGVFKLTGAEFKLYCWLLSHQDGFKFGKMFMVNGCGLRNVTIEKTLTKLINKNYIKISDNGLITIVNNDSQ